MGVRVRCRNESPLITVGVKNVAATKKARRARSHVKVMLMVFYDSEGVIHYEFLPQGRTVNKEYYLEVVQRLRETVRKKRPDAWRENRWMLQHDNAPSHSSFLVRDFLAKHATTVLPQPPYSPDLAPADFFLFPKLKSTLKGRRFEYIEEIKTNSLAHLRSIPKTAFQECFRKLKKRWQRCIQSRREYFEGDKAEQVQGKTGKFLRDIFGNFLDRPRIHINVSTNKTRNKFASKRRKILCVHVKHIKLFQIPSTKEKNGSIQRRGIQFGSKVNINSNKALRCRLLSGKVHSFK